jgi:hypothetical protein
VHRLDERFQRTVQEELAKPGTRRPPWELRLPVALRETMVALGEPENAAQFYCEHMPRTLVEQMWRGDDPARALLHRPIDLYRLPRLRTALERLEGAPQGKTIAEIASKSMLGTGLPMVGAYPAELKVIEDDLRERDADEVLDLRLSGGLMHELCHRETGAPWMVLEGVAIWRGAKLFERHIFPEVAGEAVPGVSLFAILGQALERCGPPAMERLFDKEREEWQERREAPFARDALKVLEWVKLVEGGWRDEDPNALDFEIARTAVKALFQVNVLAPTFQTHPLAEIRNLRIDPAASRIERDPVSQGVFGEPAFWLWPPPLCRNCRPICIERVGRDEIDVVTERLIEWTSSKS